MELYKPLIKWKAAGIKIMFLIGGLVMIGLGVYFTFVQGRDYVKATAVIVSIREEERYDVGDRTRSMDYWPTVRYTVDGREYRQELDTTAGKDDTGKEIKIKYDPNDPDKVVGDALGMKLYLLIVGPIVTIGALFALLKTRSQVKRSREEQPVRSLFGASRPGAAERSLYFLTDTGTVKGSCHIEDENRSVLYEALCSKFSPLAETEYEFVDHVLGTRRTHLVGGTATTSSDGFFVLDKHSTFNLDGVDIWKQLHNNGISIQTGLNGIKWSYSISRDGMEIAQVTGTSQYVHEEDEAAHQLASKLPAPGFFRIRTREENLDAIFMTLFAIGRTDMMIYN